MKKKIMALVLASIMTVGCTMTAFAEDTTLNDAEVSAGTKIEVSSKVELPIIKVVVPTTAKIILNPFKMEATVVEADEDHDIEEVKSSDQILCASQKITSFSNVKIDVNVADLVAKPSDGVLVSATSAAKLTTKSAYVFLKVGTTTLACGTETKPAAKTQVATLDICDLDEEGNLAEEAVAPSVEFTFGGDMVANPTVLNSERKLVPAPWTDADSINVEFKFTFTPVVNTVTS